MSCAPAANAYFISVLVGSYMNVPYRVGFRADLDIIRGNVSLQCGAFQVLGRFAKLQSGKFVQNVFNNISCPTFSQEMMNL